MSFRRLSIVVFALSFAGAVTAGEVYTNLVGRTISAKPLRIERQKVVFAVAPKGERTVPLSAFPESERTRIKAALGIREVPSALRPVAAGLSAQYRRAEARTAAGRMTSAELEALRGGFAAAWSDAVAKSELSESDKTYWRCRSPWRSSGTSRIGNP